MDPNLMLNLITQLPRISYEPVGIAALVGIVFFISGKRQAKSVLWLVLILLAGMAGWRLLAHVISSRYSAALLFPIILFAGIACYEAGIRLSEYLSGRMKLSAAWKNVICWSPAGLLLIACMGKELRYNPYSETIASLGKSISTDAAERKSVWLFAEQPHLARMAYYSGIRNQDELNCDDASGNMDTERLKTFVRSRRFLTGRTIYIFGFETGEKRIQAGQLEIPENDWHCLSWFYSNRTKKRCIAVYRYTPSVSADAPENSAGPSEIILNGDFERPGNPKFTEEVRGQLKKRSACFSEPPGIAGYPLEWFCIWVPASSRFGCGLTEENRIAGKYSLRIVGDPASEADKRNRVPYSKPYYWYEDRLIYLNFQKISPSADSISLSVRGVESSEFSVCLNLIFSKEKVKFKEIARLEVGKGKTRFLSIPLDPSDLENAGEFSLAVKLEKGDLILDDIGVGVPASSSRQNTGKVSK